MRPYWILIGFTVALFALDYAFWPAIHPYMGLIKGWLILFKKFCIAHPLLGYAAYIGVLALVLFLGLPLAMAIMLLAGVTYDFWEATVLLTFCRLAVAVAAFLLVRHLVHQERSHRPQPVLLRKFEEHPRVGLLLARLAPLPETTVNYAMGASSLDCMQYTVISLIGMIPLTMLCVWMGNELGSVSHLIRMFN